MKRPAITPAMRLQVFKEFGAVVLCQVCGNTQRVADVAIDHHLALIDGGLHDTANLRPICTVCHKPKSATEHKNNAKAKRLAKARDELKAVLSGEKQKRPGTIKSRPFSGWRKFDGSIVRK